MKSSGLIESDDVLRDKSLIESFQAQHVCHSLKSTLNQEVLHLNMELKLLLTVNRFSFKNMRALSHEQLDKTISV